MLILGLTEQNLYLALINWAGGLYMYVRILTEVVSTDWTLYTTEVKILSYRPT